VKQEELLLEMKAERLIKRGGTRYAPARLPDPADPRLWARLARLCEERRKEKEQERSLKQEATGAIQNSGDDVNGVEDENRIRVGPPGDLAAIREERRRRYREEGQQYRPPTGKEVIDLGGEVPRIGVEEAKVGPDGEIQHGPPPEGQFKAESQGGSKFKIPQSARDGKPSPSQIQIQRRPGQGRQQPLGYTAY
jgi:hypothetical protein